VNTLLNEFLINSVWQFFHEHGPVTSEQLFFLKDGSVAGYDNYNERRWEISGDVLILRNEVGIATCVFDNMTTFEGLIRLRGKHLPRPEITLCLTQKEPWKFSRVGTRESLKSEALKHGWQIGDHTYGVPSFIDIGHANLNVGKYTSIAGGSKISFADHRMELVSTFPFCTLRDEWPSAPHGESDHKSKGNIVIGSDVWIGTDALILSGVTVGHGAVIAAKSVVTKDVLPYSVVGGVPAKTIRFRFSKEIIEQLLEIQWWDWPDEIVNSFLPLIMSPNLEGFVRQAKARPMMP
jgi:acetyltransferase-like isoleucine patch superfamily enzyme